MKAKKLCIIGNARTQQKNPITARFSHFFIVFIVEAETGIITDLDVTVMLPATGKFIKELFMGRSLASVDKELLEEIRTTYLASSQKAMQMAYMEAVKKYRAWRSEHPAAESKDPG